jgi:hypothetical protein
LLVVWVDGVKEASSVAAESEKCGDPKAGTRIISAFDVKGVDDRHKAGHEREDRCGSDRSICA